MFIGNSFEYREAPTTHEKGSAVAVRPKLNVNSNTLSGTLLPKNKQINKKTNKLIKRQTIEGIT